MADFVGIAREALYSPGKVEADRGILDAVADRLRAAHDVRVVSAEGTFPAVLPRTIVFTMCQGPEALEVMKKWEAGGIRVINSSRGIENCHRRRMLAEFRRHGVDHPESTLVSTNPAEGSLAAAENRALPESVRLGIWVKRGDVHATEAGDVVRVESEAGLLEVLADFRRRGIDSALLQRHVPGTVIKFYAVKGGYFAWFPEAPLTLDSDAVARMHALAEDGARALSLEVYGGDCVCDPNGRFHLIDLNDWPSYGRCRVAAGEAIAAYLEAQIEVRNEAP